MAEHFNAIRSQWSRDGRHLAGWIVPEPGCRLYGVQWTARGVMATHQCPKKSFETTLQVFAAGP